MLFFQNLYFHLIQNIHQTTMSRIFYLIVGRKYFWFCRLIHFYKTFQLEDLEKGEKCYYCDLCPQRKRIKGDTPKGIKKSMVCHLAVQHGELRSVMDKDPRLSKEFIKAVSDKKCHYLFYICDDDIRSLRNHSWLSYIAFSWKTVNIAIGSLIK